MLIAYLRTADNAMRVERVAALKNDVMNLMRSQESPPKGLADWKCLSNIDKYINDAYENCAGNKDPF